MPSIYTQPTQSQFVPTYQPIPADMMLQGLQQRQKKHEQNLAQLDALRSTQNQLSNYVFEEDQPVLDEKMGVVKNELDRLAQQGDLSDAGRKVRDVARGFREEVQTGDVAKAFENFQKVQQKYKQIEESDLPQSVKERRKNAIIANYKGVGEGGLDLNVTTDYIDVGQYAKDTLGDMDKNKITSFISSPQGKSLSQAEKDKLQKFGQGEVTIEQVPAKTARKVLKSKIMNDPEAQAGLLQRARTETANMDSYQIDGEEVSRQEKMQSLMEGYINDAAHTYAATTQSTALDLTETPEGELVNTPGASVTVEDRGVTRAVKYAPNDFASMYDKAIHLENTGKEGTAQQLKTNLDIAATGLINSRKHDFSRDDYEKLKELQTEVSNIREKEGESPDSETNRPAMVGIGGVAGYATEEGFSSPVNLKDKLGEEKYNKYMNLKSTFNDYVQKGGGVTEVMHSFAGTKEGNDAYQEFKQGVRRMNPESVKIFAEGDVDSREFLTQKATSDGDQTVLETFDPHGIIRGRQGVPTRIKGQVNTPDGVKDIQIAYKRQPNMDAEQADYMDGLLRNLGPVGQTISNRRRTEHIQPSYDFKNILNELPSTFRQQAIQNNNQYVGIRETEEGIQASVGSSDESAKPITVADYIGNLHQWGGPKNQQVESILNQLDDKNIFTPKEKQFILSGGLKEQQTGDLSDEERQTRRSVMSKLEKSFDRPYPFISVYNATKAAANFKK